MGEAEMVQVAEWISRVADDSGEENLATIKKEIGELAAKFPVPGI
jgi:glycine/serine hydroxymethyltransferase